MVTLDEQVKELTERVEKLERQLGIGPLKGLVADFKGLMMGLDIRTLEYVFQGESEHSLAYSFMGQPKEVLESVKKALSKIRWNRVCAEMNDLMTEGVTESSVKASQEGLQRKVQKLEEMGGIVVDGSVEPHESFLVSAKVIALLKNLFLRESLPSASTTFGDPRHTSFSWGFAPSTFTHPLFGEGD